MSSLACCCYHPTHAFCVATLVVRVLWLLQHLSPSLGVEVVYRDYGTYCSLVDPATGRLAWSNIRSTVFDEFVIAHSLGWWAKALLIRNNTLLWVYSIGFELMELTFAVGGCAARFSLNSRAYALCVGQ